MHSAIFLVLALAASARTAPTAPQQPPATPDAAPSTPPTSSSTGIVLVANVSDPSRDFSPSVNGWLLQALHVGAALNAAVLVAPPARTPVFYLNDTADADADADTDADATLLTDAGTPLFPFGLSVQGPDQFAVPAAAAATPAATGPDGEHSVAIDVGSGSPVALPSQPDDDDGDDEAAPWPALANLLGDGTFLACNRTIQYYQVAFTVVEFAYETLDENGDLVTIVPDGCVPITLVPQCAVLADLPQDAVASHEFALAVSCFANVSAVDWSGQPSS